MWKPLKLSLIYFLLVFAAGFLLGTLRTLFLLPVMSARYAELLEMPIMLCVIYFSAKIITGKTSPENKNRDHLLIGTLALLFLLIAEFTLVLRLRGISIWEYFTTHDAVSGIAYVFSLVLYLLMPFWVGKRDQSSRKY